MNKLNLGIACAVLATPALMAQGLDPRLGSPQGGLADQLIPAAVSLGFTFTSPGGSAWTALDVDTHGRVFAPGATGGLSDFSPTAAEFVTIDHLAPYHTDVVPGTSGGDVWFFTDPAAGPGGEAVITWLDVEPFGIAGAPFSFQLIIRGDGSFSYLYDGRVPVIAAFGANSEAIVGTSDGLDAGAAPLVDLSNYGGGLVSPNGDGMLYEDFPAGGSSFDLTAQRLDFFPAGGPGLGYVGVGQQIDFATATKVGPNCDFGSPAGPPIALQFIPSGTGWTIFEVPAVFDANIGTSMGMGDDTIFTASLGGATFTMPDGSAYSQLDIDSNGKINVVGTDASDFTPSPAELTSAPSLAPFWTDLSPNAGGDASFFTDGATVANITWQDVPEFGETNAITLQVQLDLAGVPGTFTVVYQDVGTHSDILDDLIIGASDGLGGAPLEEDLTNATGGGALITGPSTYEFFDSGAAEAQDLQLGAVIQTMDYNFLNTPLNGTVYNTVATGIPATASSGFILAGFQRWPAGIPGLTTPDGFALLSLLDASIPDSCVLTHQIGYFSLPLSAAEWGGAGDTDATWDLDLTAGDPAAIGLPLNTQMIFIDTGAPWGAGAFPLITTNGIEAFAGF